MVVLLIWFFNFIFIFFELINFVLIRLDVLNSDSVIIINKLNLIILVVVVIKLILLVLLIFCCKIVWIFYRIIEYIKNVMNFLVFNWKFLIENKIFLFFIIGKNVVKYFVNDMMIDVVVV